jgi:hypothetical protein
MSEADILVFPTKGEFLKEKMTNLARWVTQEVGEENLPVDVFTGIADRSVVEVTALSGALDANNTLVTTRNWSGLVQLMNEHGAVRELQEVVVAVQRRPEMHDKFWRYMNLFIEVARQ